jgi:hypothetical protein
MIRNSRQKPKGRRWNFEEKVLAVLYLNVAPNLITFSRHYCPFHLDDPCNLS